MCPFDGSSSSRRGIPSSFSSYACQAGLTSVREGMRTPYACITSFNYALGNFGTHTHTHGVCKRGWVQRPLRKKSFNLSLSRHYIYCTRNLERVAIGFPYTNYVHKKCLLVPAIVHANGCRTFPKKKKNASAVVLIRSLCKSSFCVESVAWLGFVVALPVTTWLRSTRDLISHIQINRRSILRGREETQKNIWEKKEKKKECHY